MSQDSQIEIINGLSATRFQRFCLSFLYEMGLKDISLVHSPDNGIVAGKGAIDLGIVKSYRFFFFGKQQAGTIGDDIIQKIREQMGSDTDKGLVFTTGYFSREGKRQAKAKGKPPIDLIDQNSLTGRLKDYNLKISVETGAVFRIDQQQEI